MVLAGRWSGGHSSLASRRPSSVLRQVTLLTRTPSLHITLHCMGKREGGKERKKENKHANKQVTKINKQKTNKQTNRWTEWMEQNKYYSWANGIIIMSLAVVFTGMNSQLYPFNNVVYQNLWPKALTKALPVLSLHVQSFQSVFMCVCTVNTLKPTATQLVYL